MQAQQITANFDQKLKEAFEKGKQMIPLSPQNNYKESDKDTKLGLINHKGEDPNFKCGVARGEGLLQVNTQKFLASLSDSEQMTKTQKKLKIFKPLGKTTENNSISFMVFSSPIGDDRETAVVSGVFQEGNTQYYVLTSVEHPDHLKAQKGNTQCIQYYNMYALTPQGENTHVVFVSCMDPKGSIPGFVKNKMNNSRAIERLAQLNEYFKSN